MNLDLGWVHKFEMHRQLGECLTPCSAIPFMGFLFNNQLYWVKDPSKGSQVFTLVDSSYAFIHRYVTHFQASKVAYTLYHNSSYGIVFQK